MQRREEQAVAGERGVVRQSDEARRREQVPRGQADVQTLEDGVHLERDEEDQERRQVQVRIERALLAQSRRAGWVTAARRGVASARSALMRDCHPERSEGSRLADIRTQASVILARSLGSFLASG